MSSVFFWAGIALMGLGTLAGSFPLWKSATLSPDSIQRRVYWVGSSSSAVRFSIAAARLAVRPLFWQLHRHGTCRYRLHLDRPRQGGRPRVLRLADPPSSRSTDGVERRRSRLTSGL